MARSQHTRKRGDYGTNTVTFASIGVLAVLIHDLWHTTQAKLR